MNTKILGALVFGVGLIGLSLWGAKDTIVENNQTALAAKAAPKAYIAVADENQNGIPDWREQLRTAPTITFDRSTTEQTATYTPPETLTGQLAISLAQQSIEVSQFGLGTDVAAIEAAAREIEAAATDRLYTITNANIMPSNSVADLERYGNQVAEIAIINGIAKEIKNELVIVAEAIAAEDPEALADLATIKASYTAMRDDMLALPVPRSVAQQHIDLINAYNALAIDVAAMEETFVDPLYTMTRLKRYEDDVLGLEFALGQLYSAAVAEGARFETEDLAQQVFGFLGIW